MKCKKANIKDRGGGLCWLRHIFRRHQCVDSLTIDGDWIRCGKCGREVGFVFWFDGRYECFVFHGYALYEKEIKEYVAEATYGKKEEPSESDVLYEEMRNELHDEIAQLRETTDEEINDDEQQEELIDG